MLLSLVFQYIQEGYIGYQVDRSCNLQIEEAYKINYEYSQENFQNRSSQSIPPDQQISQIHIVNLRNNDSILYFPKFFVRALLSVKSKSLFKIADATNIYKRPVGTGANLSICKPGTCECVREKFPKNVLIQGITKQKYEMTSLY